MIDLANQGYVDVAVVGNEVLLRKELSVEEIIDYLKQAYDVKFNKMNCEIHEFRKKLFLRKFVSI